MGCAHGDDAGTDEVAAIGTTRDIGLSFEQFEARAFREPETGIYIVDGDTPVLNAKLRREFYDQLGQPGALIVDRQGGVDSKWSDTQKQNITWDTDQRRSYARSLLIALGAYGVVLLVIGIVANWGVRQFFEGPAIFALTVLVVGGKHYMDHQKAAEELDQLKSHLTTMLHEANNAPESAALTAKARDLQTEIFHQRKEHPPIFDWYYSRVKKDKESVARPASA